mgnify:CR=1 FL=1
MSFSTLPFLFYFLPAFLAVYYIVPARFRNAVLALGSLLFYWLGAGTGALLVLVALILVNFAAGRLIEDAHSDERRAWLILALACDVGSLFYFKYMGWFLENLGRLTNTDFSFFRVALPLGVSFYVFQSIAYIADVYRGDAAVQRDPLKLALYIAFFPQLVAGPIVRYTTVAEEIDERHESVSEFSAGAVRFLFGLGKKMLLANAVARIADAAFAAAMPSVLFAWLGAVAYTFQIYFDFSAYSDMAIGLGRMFGFHFLENFNYPYVARSVTEFWRRWHISLSTWFRDYVYIPLGGNRCSRARNVWNLFVVWFLTGMWHGASWNFIAWGLWFFVLLVGEKLLWGKVLECLPSLVRHAYAMVLVVFSWVLFRAETLTAAAAYLAAMFGSSGVWCGSRVVYYALEFWPELLCCCIAALPVKQWLETALQKRDAAPARAVLTWGPKLAAMALLACSYCKLVTGSFNPFIYFRF